MNSLQRFASARKWFSTIVGAVLCASVSQLASSDEAGKDGIGRPINLEAPVVSPDGQTIAFVSDATGKFTLWLARRDGSAPRVLVNWETFDQRDPDWAPNGQKLVFASDRDSRSYDIWTVLPDGTGAVRLTTTGGNRQPRYSPDATKILFTSNRTGKRELWVMSADGTNQKPVALQSLLISDPAWSPDSKSIVYAGCERPPIGAALSDGKCNLFRISLDASTAKQLTTGNVRDWNPDWGSAGIVFSSSRAGGQSLWMIEANGNNLQRLTAGGRGLDLFPRWDRSANTIVFAKVAGSSNVWAVGSNKVPIQLTTFAARTVQGDVNSDGVIDCEDVAIVKRSLGRRSDQAGYDVRADVDRDGKVDGQDLVFVSHRAVPDHRGSCRSDKDDHRGKNDHHDKDNDHGKNDDHGKGDSRSNANHSR